MVYLRGGTVQYQQTTVDKILSLPLRLYEFFMFFVMTLIDPTAARKASQARGARDARYGGSSSGVPARRPMGNVKGVQSGISGCGPGGG